jgi:copper transporter 1
MSARNYAVLLHVALTALHIVRVFVAYTLMLVFMTFNVWLCLSVIIGAGVGYLLLGWKRATFVPSDESIELISTSKLPASCH